MKKQWFIYFSVRDPRSGKMVRFRKYEGFTGLSYEERINLAIDQVKQYTERLKSGWNPIIDDQEILYDNNLAYKTVSDILGKARGRNRTLELVINGYLDYVRDTIAHASYLTYKSKLRIFALWSEHHKLMGNDISCFNNAIIIKFFSFLINDRKLSRKSVIRYKQVLSMLFNYARNKLLIKINPVFNIPACTRINDHTPRPISRCDVEKFKKELVLDPILWLVVQFEYYCGMRPGHEIREMKLKDIDLNQGTIHVNRIRAKNRIDRMITIPAQFLEYLKGLSFLHDYDKEYYLFGQRGIPGPRCIGKNAFTRRFKALRDRLSMPSDYTLYSWKHTAAAEIDDSDIQIRDLSQHFGHNSVNMTEIYLRNKKPSVSQAIRDHYPTL